MTDLPRGWAEARLDEVAEVRLGRQRSPKNHSGSRMRPYLRAANVTWSGLDLHDVKEMNFTEEESAVYELRTGDVVVAEASGSADEVGKPAVWSGEIDGCCFQNTLVRVRTLGPLPEYLRYFLLAEAQSGRIGRASPGVGIHHIGAARLAAWRVAVPPLAEQRRIVAAIEEHLSRLDAACDGLSRVQRLLDRWRSAAFAVLTHHEASERRVGDIARVGSGATPKRDRPDYWVDGDVPWVTSGQLTRPFVTEPAALITQKALRETSCRVWPKRTLLVAMYGEGRTRGHCSELLIDAATNQACAAIQIHDPDVDSTFLKLYFNAMYAVNRSLSAGGVQPNLSLGLIKDMTFPCPPIDEQRAIVARIEGQLARAASLGAAVRKALADSAALRHSILARALRGKLATQDPVDESATMLLERIAAERPAVPKPVRKRRERTPA